MLAARHAAAEATGRAVSRVDAERLERGGSADDVGDGVERPHLMEVHLRRRRPGAIGLPLRLGQTLEDGQRAAAHGVGQVGASRAGPHVGQVRTTSDSLADVRPWLP